MIQGNSEAPEKGIKSTEDIVTICKKKGAFVVLKRERELVDMALKAVERGVLLQNVGRSQGVYVRFEPAFTTTETGGKAYGWY